jgi:SsrA-binding protein
VCLFYSVAIDLSNAADRQLIVCAQSDRSDIFLGDSSGAYCSSQSRTTYMTTDKVVATNREAYHNFHILETHECGVALTGTEVKSAREGRCNLKDGYAQIRQNEAWLMNVHISPYTHGNRENHEPTRARKLLLHRSEIDKLTGKVQEKGLTLVPTKMYLKNGRLKIELAVAKGKKLYDKRETEKRREADREARAMIKERSRN